MFPISPPPHSSSARRNSPAAPMLRRRGVAMLLVLGVIAMASVLGYAMLSSAALQKQVSVNASASASAQGMAESGVNLAMYYLNHPEESPDYPATYPATEQYDRDGKFWAGTNDAWLNLGSPAVGAVKVKVTRPNAAVRWQYVIDSYGRVAGSSVVRRVKATVVVDADFRMDHAAVFTNDVQLTSGTTMGQLFTDGGAVYSNGALTIRSGGLMYGRGTRRRVTFTAVQPTPSSGPRWEDPLPRVPKVVPQMSEIRDYLTYESSPGVVRNATKLLTLANMGLGYAIDRLDPTAANPAGIYYVPGDLTLLSGAEVRGTLIVGGNLTIAGNNVRLRSQDGYPALIVGGNVNTYGIPFSPVVEVEGLMYVAGRLDGVGIAPTINVRGGLLVGGTSPIFPSMVATARLNVRHDADRARVPDFSNVGRTVRQVRILNWEAQAP